MSESLACFTHLADNAPLWIRSLDELQQRIQGRQAEVARVAVPIVQHKIKKTSSNESIRHSGPETSSPSTKLDMMSAPQPYDLQQTTITAGPLISPSRKRKTVSLISAASGIHKYRSRASITVYYDSEVQEAFDRLVRNISTGRNNIRKSRMTDRVASLTSKYANTATTVGGSPQPRTPVLRSVRSASGMPRFDSYIEESFRLRGRIEGLRPPLHLSPVAGTQFESTTTQMDARQLVDGALDKAQGFCERGAHQFLRDGDCGEEVAGAKAAFEEVIKISQQEIERLKKEAAAAAAAEKEEAAKAERERIEREANDDDILDSSDGQRASISQHPALIEAAKLIEPDDDEDSDEDYDDPTLLPSPPFRLMART